MSDKKLGEMTWDEVRAAISSDPHMISLIRGFMRHAMEAGQFDIMLGSILDAQAFVIALFRDDKAWVVHAVRDNEIGRVMNDSVLKLRERVERGMEALHAEGVANGIVEAWDEEPTTTDPDLN